MLFAALVNHDIAELYIGLIRLYELRRFHISTLPSSCVYISKSYVYRRLDFRMILLSYMIWLEEDTNRSDLEKKKIRVCRWLR